MKKPLFLFVCFIVMTITNESYAQYSSNFYVGGDPDKFYPVLFSDANWFNSKATELELGRSDVHTDASWRGSFIAKFRYHVWCWGNGSNFIDADIRQFNPVTNTAFIAGWADGTSANATFNIIVWLKGGATTYYVNSPVNVNPIVYDGSQNALPYQEPNGPARSYKTSVDNYVNSYGLSAGGTAYYNGTVNNNYFAGNVGIGTTQPDQKLTVSGTIHSTQVKVDLNVPGPDYVFKKDYNLPELSEVKNYIDKNHHLSEIPSADQMEKNGVDLGEMNIKLLKKVEELTLYLINEHENNKQLRTRINTLNKKVAILSNKSKTTL